MCMVAYQVVEEGVCRMYAMCMPAYQVVEEGVCRLGGQHGDMLCVW